MRPASPYLLSAIVAAVVALFSVPADGAEGEDKTAESDPVLYDDATPERHDRRRFSGLGFHSHLEIGPAYGQQVIQVERVDASTAVTGEPESDNAVASGFGLATRLELWPAYGRHGGVGFYGEGLAGGARREGGGTGVFTGSGGMIFSAGLPRVKAMFVVGRSRRAGAFGSGTDVSTDVSTLSADSRYTAGAEDVRSHRAGFGVRTAFDSGDRRGLDLWLLFDESVGDRAAIAMPSLSDSAMATRGTLWLRNTLVVSAEVTLRGAALDSPVEGTRVTERTAMLSVGWSMDRFSTPY